MRSLAPASRLVAFSRRSSHFFLAEQPISELANEKKRICSCFPAINLFPYSEEASSTKDAKIRFATLLLLAVLKYQKEKLLHHQLILSFGETVTLQEKENSILLRNENEVHRHLCCPHCVNGGSLEHHGT